MEKAKNEIITIVREKTHTAIIKEIKPRILEEIDTRIEEKLKVLSTNIEPKQNADEGNMEDKDAIWPNRHLPFFEPRHVQGMTDKQSLEYQEPLFAVMGNGLRMLTMVTGYLEDTMSDAIKAKHVRNLLVHYQQDLTTNEPKGRLITEILTNQLVNAWAKLTSFVTIPGRLNKNHLGDVINELMVHLDGEILPAANLVVRNLLTLKVLMAQPSGITNMEVLQNVAKITVRTTWALPNVTKIVVRTN